MKILYDYQTFMYKFGGISRYFCEIIKRLDVEHQTTVATVFSENVYLNSKDSSNRKLNILPSTIFPGRGILRRSSNDLNRWYSKFKLQNSEYDVFHPTYYDPYFLDLLKTPFVLTVHDLTHEIYKDSYFSYDTITVPNKKKLLAQTTRIIAISENTKKDLIEFYQIDPDRIDVIYHGIEKRHQVLTTMKRTRPYILFVGARQGYKNFETFLKAIANIFKNEQELILICVGLPFNSRELSEIDSLKLSGRVFSKAASESELNGLYVNAMMFVYPSLYEGFGLPILEAFVNCCPVCLSRTSCFPEVADDAAVYFEPDSIDDIQFAMEKIIYNSDLANDLRKKGLERASLFSWDKAAQQTLDTYNKAIK